jgi:type II secretory pathway pseudopilin PulG
MALMVAAILLTVLSPLVVLSTSYRVQARRVDLATQAARSYIDGLRSDSISPPTTRVDLTLPEMGAAAPTAKPDPLTDPGTCLDKNLNSLSNCNDPTNFLVIQAFRNGPPYLDSNGALIKKIPEGYCVGVRVYRADAFDGTTLTETQPPKSGLSNSRYAPLVVMRAEIINQASFQKYAERFTTGDSPCPPPT